MTRQSKRCFNAAMCCMSEVLQHISDILNQQLYPYDPHDLYDELLSIVSLMMMPLPHLRPKMMEALELLRGFVERLKIAHNKRDKNMKRRQPRKLKDAQTCMTENVPKCGVSLT